MAELNLTEGLRTIVLAGIGAIAGAAEKGEEVVADLVKKGELTVEQGKALNQELSRKAKDVVSEAPDAVLRYRMKSMTPEERADYAAKVAQMAADIDAETVEVDVENIEEDVEDVEATEDAQA